MKTLFILLLTASFCFAREYPATVVSVYDGDTCTVILDLGMGVTLKETIRINGIDAPERPTAAGKRSQVELMKLILGKEVLITTSNDKREKYGRLLAQVIFGEIDISAWMIQKGLAKEYHGGSRIIVPASN